MQDCHTLDTGHKVSPEGKVYSCHGRELSRHLQRGVPHVDIFKNGKRKRVSVARLVLTAFKGRRGENFKCLHKDNNLHNVCIDNLEWVEDSTPMRKGRKVRAQFPDGSLHYFKNVAEAVEQGPYSESGIRKSCTGIIKKHRGLKWRYVDGT